MIGSASQETLARRIDDRSAVIGILGLGYVGLPLALAFAEKGFGVLGFDVDPSKIESLRQGDCYIHHLDASRLETAISNGRFGATSEFDRLGEPDVLIICVPTPLTKHREPDLSYVESTTREIQSRLRSGQMVVLESTTYPGTTDELLRSMLERDGLVCGDDFFLAYSPEREDPGNATHSTATIPKVVGGVDEASGDLAESLYRQIVPQAVRVSNARTAEATKLMENIFRAVNIALVNELKVVYDKMDIDVWEVLDAAETKPFGFMRFSPGPGWGGHCIPLDPFYLSWKAREHGVAPKFIELAGEVNVQMPEYVISKLARALNDREKSVRGSRILLLGLAYKKDIDDPRESPAFELLEHLLALGAKVDYHDPHIPEAPSMRSWPDLPAMRSIDPTPETLAEIDAVLIVTDHTAVDYEEIANSASLIIDTRGVYRGPRENVVKA